MSNNCCGNPNICTCDSCNPCKPKVTRRTSEECYDGCDIKELCIRSGMSLNEVIKRLADAIISNIQISSQVYTEFTDDIMLSSGKKGIVLKNTPYSILFVWHCGTVVPTSAYTVSGKTLILNDTYCFADGHELGVAYQARVDNNC